MTDTKKEVINELYDATDNRSCWGILPCQDGCRKSLGAPLTREGAAKLAIAVAGSAFTIGYLKGKGYIPKMIDK